MTPFVVLYREFLRRLFDVEMLSVHARGDASGLLSQVATILICVSILMVFPAFAFDGNMSGPAFIFGAWSFQHFLIATTMVIVGLFATLNWNAMFPEKRDLQVLLPLPVPLKTIFLAKVAAVGTGLAVAVLVLHCIAGLIWPFAFNKTMAALRIPTFSLERRNAAVGCRRFESRIG